jgi:hypothetical protein
LTRVTLYWSPVVTFSSLKLMMVMPDPNLLYFPPRGILLRDGGLVATVVKCQAAADPVNHDSLPQLENRRALPTMAGHELKTCSAPRMPSAAFFENRRNLPLTSVVPLGLMAKVYQTGPKGDQAGHPLLHGHLLEDLTLLQVMQLNTSILTANSNSWASWHLSGSHLLLLHCIHC